MTDNPKRLIEVAFPLKQTSLDSVHEKTCGTGTSGLSNFRDRSDGEQPDPIPPEGTPPPLTEGYLTAKEAAERMGLSVEAVRAMCNDGSLSDAVRKHGRWHVPPDTVEAWQHGQSKEASALKVAGTHTKWCGYTWKGTRSSGMMATLPLQSLGILSHYGDLRVDCPGRRALRPDSGRRRLRRFSRQVKEWGLVREFPAEREGETLIVIARFYHSEGVADTEAHNEIRHAIQAAAEELGESSLRVAVSSIPIAADDRTRAKKLGKQYNASIVIWGADTGVRVTVNFLNLKQPDFDAAQVQISETQRTQIADPAHKLLRDARFAGQLSFLSFFAVGQSYYAGSV